MNRSEQPYRVVEAGDSALLVEFEERIDARINAAAVALAAALRDARLPGVRDVVPTFRSVAIYFDPLRTDIASVAQLIDASVVMTPAEASLPSTVRIPVCYGGEFGPDLREVAAFAGVSEDAVVDIHVSHSYRVFMLGFLPGFAYMGLVDQRIAAPRRATPRLRVPAGSVGIAGAQTGVYPSTSPGGWQLIGRTPYKPFDPGRPKPFGLAAGDTVQFYSISEADFEKAVDS
jgi:KipI family sensor histidine kinase inhibitor